MMFYIAYQTPIVMWVINIFIRFVFVLKCGYVNVISYGPSVGLKYPIFKMLKPEKPTFITHV